jgi:hypothetical protein
MGFRKQSTDGGCVGFSIQLFTPLDSTSALHISLLDAPGSRGLLPAPSPLRTVRDSFPSHGSSIPKGETLLDYPLRLAPGPGHDKYLIIKF